MGKLKVVLILALAVVAIVVIIQNTEAVETRLLFLTITMPRALLLLLSTLVGFVAGALTASLLGWRAKSA